MSVKKSSDVDRRVGDRIRSLRLQKGMSQTEVAAHLGGISFQQLQKYEKGVNRVGPERLQILADLFGVPVSTFFDREANEGNDTDLARKLLTTRDGVALAKAFIGIRDANARRAIVRMVETFTAVEAGELPAAAE